MDDGDGAISDYWRNFNLFSVNSSHKVINFGLHLVAIIGNIVIALGG